MSRAAWSLVLAFAASGCLVLQDRDTTPRDTRCVGCHGDAATPGDAVMKSAPPTDASGRTDVSAPGVGAHQRHLTASPRHAAVACAECHRVPDTTESVGHSDTEGPAELVFGPLASKGGRAPRYTFTSRRCSDSYCHGGAPTQSWTRPRTGDEACGSCHGLPPALPHPQSQRCHACHGEVVAPDGRTFTAPALHVDGTLQQAAPTCSACHGSDDAGAPPVSLDGGTQPAQSGVGAHTAHLVGSGLGRPVPCGECHPSPSDVPVAVHPSGGPAQVRFTGAALGPRDGGSGAWDSAAATCTAWCHTAGQPGATSPLWTRVGAPLACDGCHGLPPPAPHSGWQRCEKCHLNATGLTASPFVTAAQHVNGVVEAAPPAACDGCHGSAASPAPPTDVAGNTATTAPGVGAHQAHLVGSGFARPVACGECHAVPATTLSPGHADGVTQVAFSGPATNFGAQPVYANGSCANSACHDTKFQVGGRPTGGGATAPEWTRVDGSQKLCSSCHAFPPAPPHVARTDCGGCHLNLGGGTTFLRPELHIDGQLTFTVP